MPVPPSLNNSRIQKNRWRLFCGALFQYAYPGFQARAMYSASTASINHLIMQSNHGALHGLQVTLGISGGRPIPARRVSVQAILRFIDVSLKRRFIDIAHAWHFDGLGAAAVVMTDFLGDCVGGSKRQRRRDD